MAQTLALQLAVTEPRLRTSGGNIPPRKWSAPVRVPIEQDERCVAVAAHHARFQRKRGRSLKVYGGVFGQVGLLICGVSMFMFLLVPFLSRGMKGIH